jgi:cysteine desulfuration protein SufE
VYYQGESNTDIAGGIVSMLVEILSGQTPDDILNTELYFIDRIGLREHLSPTRSNGMLAMMKQMKMYASVFKAQNE